MSGFGSYDQFSVGGEAESVWSGGRNGIWWMERRGLRRRREEIESVNR